MSLRASLHDLWSSHWRFPGDVGRFNIDTGEEDVDGFVEYEGDLEGGLGL